MRFEQTDSLDSLNIGGHHELQQDGGNQNNYEFLIDEEYQHMKIQKDKVQTQKWINMGEKVSFKLLLKEIVKDFDELNRQLMKQSTYQEQLIQSSSNTTQKPAYKSFDNHYHNKAPSLKQLSVFDLLKEVRSQQKSISTFSANIIESSSSLSKLYQKEQDQIVFLERQMQQRQDSDPQQERYIDDLELQLKETRGALLDKKLKLTDKEEEVSSLKKQLQNLYSNFTQLDEQKREIDQLVIKVSQELKSKEYDMRDFNYQLHQDKEHLTRQVDILKKELAEEKDRKEKLEMIEGDIIHKLQVKENEVQDLRAYISEMDEKLQLKTEAIEKAQKVIHMLNDEMERTTVVIGKLEQERDHLRAECKEQSKRIIDVNKQLQTQVTQQQYQQAQVSNQLKTEIDELRVALAQYQQEYDNEKKQLQETLRDVNEQRYTLQVEKEKLDYSHKKQIANLQEHLSTIECQNTNLTTQNTTLERELKEKEETFNQMIAQREDQAQSQIRYLQKRIKDISNEQTHRYQPSASGYNNGSSNDKNSYLEVVKQEFDKVVTELSDIRGIIKKESVDQQSTVILKMKAFEDFKDKVLQNLTDWDSKAQDLAKLSQTYQSELDEQRKLFLSMRHLIKEKDILISSLQKQMKAKDQQHSSFTGTLKKELERQTFLIRQDLIEQIKNQENKIDNLCRENYESDARFQSFKYEYAQILDEREHLKNLNLRMTGQVEVLSNETENLQHEYLTFVDKVRVVIGINTQNKTLTEILNELEQQIDELKIRKDEVISYKAQISSQSQQIEQDKNFMSSKIQAVEQQLECIQRQSLSKEEEQQVQYLQRETKYINEIQKMQADLTSYQSQLQTRERQVKKLQEKSDHQLAKATDLETQLEESAKLRRHIQEEHQLTNDSLCVVKDELARLKDSLKAYSEKIQLLEDEKRKQDERYKCIKEAMFEKEIEMQRERDLNLQLQDEKYKAVNLHDNEKEKREVFERENQSLYKELQMQKQTIQDISQAFSENEREKYSLQKSYHQMHDIVEEAQNEINQSQHAIETLNSALEKSKAKGQKIKDLKHQVRILKINEKQQLETINELRRHLNPPRQSIEIQTQDSSMQEIQYMREETIHNQKQSLAMQRECEQIREALRRQSTEIDRLIDEKRDLEDLVDQQNQSIKQIRFNNAFKENVNTNNNGYNHLNSSGIKSHNIGGELNMELYGKILQEKENYIMRLEGEISEMRREIENLKEKQIQYEIGNLTLDKSQLGASQNPQFLTQQMRSQQQSFQMPSKQRPNNLKGTNNSLNMSNLMYNQTPTTNFGTLQNMLSEDTRGGGNASGLGPLFQHQ